MIVRKLFILCSAILILWIIKGAFTSKDSATTQEAAVAQEDGDGYRELANAKNVMPATVNAAVVATSAQEADHQIRMTALLSCKSVTPECPILNQGADLSEKTYLAASAIVEEIALYKADLDSGKADIAKASELVRAMLQYPDERVKLEALKLINERDLEFDSLLYVLLDQLEEAVDPQLIVEALQRLQKYMNTAYEEEVLSFVESVLMQGSQQASRQLAELSYMLMSQSNRARFERWAAEMPEKSLKRELLEASLHRAFP